MFLDKKLRELNILEFIFFVAISVRAICCICEIRLMQLEIYIWRRFKHLFSKIMCLHLLILMLNELEFSFDNSQSVFQNMSISPFFSLLHQFDFFLYNVCTNICE